MFAMVVWEKGDLEAHDLAILDRFFQHVRWSSDRSPQLKHLPDQQKLMDELQMMLKPSPQPQGSQIPMPPADHRL
jgi:hypothetical protein